MKTAACEGDRKDEPATGYEEQVVHRKRWRCKFTLLS